MYLSVSPTWPEEFGIQIADISFRCMESSINWMDLSELLASKACRLWTFTAESKPAVTRREVPGSYKHRHTPLPLQRSQKVQWSCKNNKTYITYQFQITDYIFLPEQKYLKFKMHRVVSFIWSQCKLFIPPTHPL